MPGLLMLTGSESTQKSTRHLSFQSYLIHKKEHLIRLRQLQIANFRRHYRLKSVINLTNAPRSLNAVSVRWLLLLAS